MERLVRPAVRATLDTIDGILDARRGKTIDDYANEWVLRHAVQGGVEIVSEAARRIPPEIRARQAHIPWREIIGVGNVLRHEYHRVSDTIVWNIVERHLPPLRAAVAEIDASPQEN